MKNTKALIIGNSVAFLAMVYVNYLSNALPINGNTPGQLSDKYVNYFVPAGLTFAVWGVIYGWLFVFILFQIFSFFSENIAKKIEPIIEKIGWLFIISCFLNVGWLLAWHYEFVGLSVLIMLSFLSLLLYLNFTIGVGKFKINSLEKWVSHAPFSLYLGWISIATIANITAFLVNIQWDGFGIEAVIWAKILIVIGAVIAGIVLAKSGAIFYGFVVIWAFYGIHLKRRTLADSASLEINTIALFCIGFVAFAILYKSKKWFDY